MTLLTVQAEIDAAWDDRQRDMERDRLTAMLDAVLATEEYLLERGVRLTSYLELDELTPRPTCHKTGRRLGQVLLEKVSASLHRRHAVRDMLNRRKNPLRRLTDAEFDRLKSGEVISTEGVQLTRTQTALLTRNKMRRAQATSLRAAAA